MRILVGLMFLLVACPAAWGVEVFYPGDGLSFGRDLLIVNTANPQTTAYTIELNGKKSGLIDISSAEYREYFEKYLIVSPGFASGRNKLVVEEYAEGKLVGTAQVMAYYLPEVDSAPPAGMEPFVMHTPENEQKCVGCHEMNPDKVQLSMTSIETNPCGVCHFNMLDKSYVHGPAGTMECLFCHDKSGSASKYRLTLSGAELCEQCHDSKHENSAVHGPVEIGECEWCHDPHSSNNFRQLHLPVNDLCMKCHEDVGKGVHVTKGVGGKNHPLGGVADPSATGRDINCASCHEPHSAKGPKYFVGDLTNRMMLCLRCHKK